MEWVAQGGLCFWMVLRGSRAGLLGVFGGHEVLVTKCERECLAGLEFFESVGVGIRWTIGVAVEIVGQYVDDFTNRAVGVGIRVSWIEVDLDRLAWGVGVRCWLRDIFHYYGVVRCGVSVYRWV
ncbi:hypothetical protein [Halalkalicoccus tibetensis]|uniref:Uncharacterized protein n=1 Tax=Halalkalicoccus tibetensis TaxID=175632 RepID=A0ABD5VBZ5_9EURY